MIPIKPWAKMPTEWITDRRIHEFRFNDTGSCGTTALLLFFSLCQTASEITSVDEHSVNVVHVAKPTYDEMANLASLSRAKIHSGLELLEVHSMISREKDGRAGKYKLAGLEKGKRWAKLPGRDLLSSAKTAFLPFSRFTLRSKHELNALKLHLYYASVRSNNSVYSEVSFETIFEKTGVPERDIPSANSILLATGLMHRIGSDKSEDINQHQANRYFMTGYKSLLNPSNSAATAGT